MADVTNTWINVSIIFLCKTKSLFTHLKTTKQVAYTNGIWNALLTPTSVVLRWKRFLNFGRIFFKLGWLPSSQEEEMDHVYLAVLHVPRQTSLPVLAKGGTYIQVSALVPTKKSKYLPVP